MAKVGDFGTSRLLAGGAPSTPSTGGGEQEAAVVSNFGTVSHMVRHGLRVTCLGVSWAAAFVWFRVPYRAPPMCVYISGKWQHSQSVARVVPHHCLISKTPAYVLATLTALLFLNVFVHLADRMHSCMCIKVMHFTASKRRSMLQQRLQMLHRFA